MSCHVKLFDFSNSKCFRCLVWIVNSSTYCILKQTMLVIALVKLFLKVYIQNTMAASALKCYMQQLNHLKMLCNPIFLNSNTTTELVRYAHLFSIQMCLQLVSIAFSEHCSCNSFAVDRAAYVLIEFFFDFKSVQPKHSQLDILLYIPRVCSQHISCLESY